VLLKKFFNVGFDDIRVADRRAFSLEDLTRYPLFAPEFVDFLRRAMPPPRHAELVSSIVVTARKPSSTGAVPGNPEGEGQRNLGGST
jgi:hypothetical protein